LKENSERHIFHPQPQLMSRLLKLHRAIGQLAHNTPDILQLPEVLRALKNEFVHVMLRCLADAVDANTSTRGRRHDAIIARFEEFLEANPDRPLYLNEILCSYRRRGANASRLLRRVSGHGTDPFSDPPSNAPRPSSVAERGSTDVNRQSDSYRPWLLGAWPFCGGLSRRIRRAAVRDLEATHEADCDPPFAACKSLLLGPNVKSGRAPESSAH